jgi:hypothetical protein
LCVPHTETQKPIKMKTKKRKRNRWFLRFLKKVNGYFAPGLSTESTWDARQQFQTSIRKLVVEYPQRHSIYFINSQLFFTSNKTDLFFDQSIFISLWKYLINLSIQEIQVQYNVNLPFVVDTKKTLLR